MGLLLWNVFEIINIADYLTRSVDWEENFSKNNMHMHENELGLLIKK